MVGPTAERDPGLARAQALIDVGRPEQALAELAHLSAAHADDPLAFELRVSALITLDRWDEVVTTARRGLATAGPDPRLLSGLGLALHQLRRYGQAERAYLDGLALAPNDVVPLCRYSLLCLRRGRLDKAGKLLDAAANEEPTAPIVFATRVVLAFARGKHREAEEYSRQFLAEFPEDPLALALHGRSAQLRGKVGPAFELSRQAVAADPTAEVFAKLADKVRVPAYPLLRPLRPIYRFGYILYSWAARSIARRLSGSAPETTRTRALGWVFGTLVLLTGLFCTGTIGPDYQAALGLGQSRTFVLGTLFGWAVIIFMRRRR